MQHFHENIQGWFDYPDLYKKIVDEMPNNFKFAEIGVWKGKSLSYFVVEAINSGKNFETYAIDTFKGSKEHQKDQTCYDPIIDTEEGLYNHFLENIEPIKDKIKVIRQKSIDAATQFPDQYFDTLFIDASHEYEDVLADLNAWFPKVKKENFVMYGHDFDWVCGAISKFSQDQSLSLEKVYINCWKMK